MIIAGLNKAKLGPTVRPATVLFQMKMSSKQPRPIIPQGLLSLFGRLHQKGLFDGAVVAIGNAPTALLELCRLIREENARPPSLLESVGFISAVESKEEVLNMVRTEGAKAPYILARGRKGGSTIAVSIIHALLLLSTKGY